MYIQYKQTDTNTTDNYKWDGYDGSRNLLNKVGATRLSSEETILLIKKYTNGGCIESRNKVIRSNMGLVFIIAQRYASNMIPKEDLISEGVFALIKAIEKFDDSRNIKFSTYAAFWIKCAARRYVYKNKRVTTESITAIDINAAINKINPNISDEEIAQLLHYKLSYIKDIKQYTVTHEVPLDTVDIGKDETEPDFIGKMSVEYVLANGRLTEIELAVVKERIGLNDKSYSCTLQELADKFRKSRERIRQIEKTAYAKLYKKYGEQLKELL